MKSPLSFMKRNIMLPLMALAITVSSVSFDTPAEARPMWLGSSYATVAPASEKHIVGKAMIARIFEPKAPKKFFDYPQIQRAWDQGVRRFSFSFHSSSEASLRVFGDSLPSNAIVWATYLHEPEDDIEKGTITLAQYKANWVRLAPVMREYGMRPMSILMAWTLMEPSGRNPADYDLPKGTVSFAGYDAHIRDQKKPKYLAALLKKEAKRVGLPWVIPETSVSRADPLAVKRMKLFMKLMREAPDPPRFVCYWNGQGKVDARITKSVSKAFFGY